MTYLIINNQIVKSKRKLTNLIKSGEPLNINNTSLLKDMLKVSCSDEALLFGFKMYNKYSKPFATIIRDLNDIGDLFDCDRYESYCKFRLENKTSNSREAFILKYGKDTYSTFYNKTYREKPNRWTVEYYIEKGYTEEQANTIIKSYKDNIPGSLNFFIDKYGDEMGNKKYAEFGEKSKHTKEGYISKLGKEKGILEWEKYIKKKRDTSVFNKNTWISRYPNNWEDKYKEFIKNNCSNGLIDFWIKRGYSYEDAANKICDINNKRGVEFRTASKQSLKAFKPIIEVCDNLGIAYNIGIQDNSEKMLISECGKIRFYDLCLEDLNIIVEYNHEKYHPKKDDAEYMHKWLESHNNYFGEADFYKLIKNDRFKYELAKRKGYDIYYIWNDSCINDITKILNKIYENCTNKKE